MLLSRANARDISTVSHEGKVLIVVTVLENGVTKLYYTVKQDGFEESALQNPNGSGWESFQELVLPNDTVGDPSVAEKEAEEFTNRDSQYLLRSLYNTVGLTADAPVQLVSHAGHVYIFRRSTSGTLLVDRFVLDGMTNRLTPKLEVRFKRSRQRHKPLQDMKINSSGLLQSVDAPDFRDMQDQPFLEPTTEICAALVQLSSQGWFGVVVNATNEPDRYRWHIFYYNANTNKVALLTLRAGDEQMFELQDHWFRSVDPVSDLVTYGSIPGIITREFELQTAEGNPLAVTQGLAATHYDVQREQETQNGPQLIRDASKVLLAIPTDRGIGALSFAIAADGTLAQILREPQTKIHRSREREMLLPLNLLDKIRGIADGPPVAAGSIAGMSRSEDEDAADRVRIEVGAGDQAAVNKLVNGDLVKLSNTVSYDGLYRVKAVKDSTFTIDATFKFGQVGEWEKVEAQETGLTFDGQLTGYELASDGKLKVNARNHGLQEGDLVQIMGSAAYDGEYPILQHDASGFIVERLWVKGEAVNIALESRKRRGLVMDGKQDWVEVPLGGGLKFPRGFVLETWVQLYNNTDQTLIASVADLSGGKPEGTAVWQTVLGVKDGKFSFALTAPQLASARHIRLESDSLAPMNRWVHLACVFDGKQLLLLQDGAVKASLAADQLNTQAQTTQNARRQQLTAELAKLKTASDLKPQEPHNYWTRIVLAADGRALTARADGGLYPDAAGNQPEQLWRLERLAAENIIMTNKATGKVLEYSAADGTVKQSSRTEAAAQQWWVGDARGTYIIQSTTNHATLEGWDQGGVSTRQFDPSRSSFHEWRLEPVGEPLVKLVQAELDELDRQLATVEPIFLLHARGLSLGASQPRVTNTGKPAELLQGQIADVRVWTRGRTVKEINDTMYLTLTGREKDLAGYWRLGGVATEQGSAGLVYDFSVNANHGIVHGEPHAGGVTLARTLRDGISQALKFSNDDLFAVREGATYVESFEFRTDSRIDPKNADGKDGSIFVPLLWGRLSRNSEERKTCTLLQQDFEFVDAGNGWQRASCRFLVPEGVRLLRCFELDKVQGNWKTLELRRYGITLVSDTVTQTTAAETVKLKTLASPLPTIAAGQRDPADLLRELDRLEREEAALVLRQKELERLIADHLAQAAATRRRDEQQAKVLTLTRERDELQKQYEQALKTAPYAAPVTKDDGVVQHYDYIHTEEIVCPPGKVVTGIHLDAYNNRCALKLRCANLDGSGEEWQSPTKWGEEFFVLQERDWGNGIDNTWWDLVTLTTTPDKYVTGAAFYMDSGGIGIKFRVSNADGTAAVWRQRTGSRLHQEKDEDYSWLDDRKDKIGGVVLAASPFDVVDGIGLLKDGKRISPRLTLYNRRTINYYRSLREKKDAELDAARQELDRLNKALNASEEQRKLWESELKNVVARLDAVRLQISPLSSAYIEQVVQSNSTAQSMFDLPDAEDPRGLVVQGALLPFAMPASRLRAIESCVGRVTLTYQDRDGALRQTHYDTAYDADGKGEEWIADKYRVALALDGTRPAIALPLTVLTELDRQVTIEFWAKGANDLPAGVDFLRAIAANHSPGLRIQLPSSGGEVVWEAGTPAADAPIDSIQYAVEPRLYRGRWTHWAFVKDADKGELRIYVNGKLRFKNDARTQDGAGALKQPVSGLLQAELGGSGSQRFTQGRQQILPAQSTDRWRGQIAELRIWKVALDDREIEANSLLTTSGNEPGLVAYYPFNEATGTLARDHTGRTGQDLNVTGSTWVPCTAPLGRLTPPPLALLDKKTSFDGKKDFVALPRLMLDLSEGLTIEARVRFDAFNFWSGIVDLANGPGKQNIVLANAYDSKRLAFQIHNDEKTYALETPTELPQGEWVHLAAVVQKDGMAILYINGVEQVRSQLALPQSTLRSSSSIGKTNWTRDSIFQGAMEYVRVWDYALNAAQVLDNARNHTLDPIYAEYSRVRVDAQKRKSVMMLRCLALPGADGVQLLDEQRIEELEMKWIGNAQIKPTLIGYIEGPPPVPSENLTEEQDYNGATFVELIQSSDVEYSWTREQDVSLGAEVELLVGSKSETSAGAIVQTSVEEVKTGGGARLDFAYHWQNASTVSASHSLMSSDRLELRGTQEQEANFAHLGLRFIPKNIGYALVTSGLADVFVSKLKRSGRMIGYQVLPVEGVPLDVNTITFLINPAYTMSGSLDGMTGSFATSQRFFRHVPEMRSQYGSLYPASYFRLQEAYDLKAQIDKQDELHQAYFNQFNARLVDEASLNRQARGTDREESPVTLNQVDRKDELDDKIAAKEKEIKDLKKIRPVNQDRVDELEDDLSELYDQRRERREQTQAQAQEKGQARIEEIDTSYSDLSQRAHASDSFASWQTKMENLQVRAGKRNIVNTYVWDGDGGFHAEEQQFAGTVEHCIGGSFDLGFAIGGQASLAFSKVLVELNAYVQVNLTQTMNKTESSSKGLELHVDLGGVESRGITDYRDYPLIPGEKVDRYRFMSFFLENNVEHWHGFFNSVVDPEWLASNDEEARALRQTQLAAPNKVWRVLHRVTYVERPALMGFGRTATTRDRAADDIRELRQQVDDLNSRMVTMQKEINDKLDQLLTKKP